MANGVVLVAVGCLTGVLAGMLGAGGGFATVVLLLAAGADPEDAVGTSLVYLLIMGSWGTFIHLRRSSVDRRLAVGIGAAAALFALVGAQIAESLGERDLALALGFFTACVSGVSLAWPQGRRPGTVTDVETLPLTPGPTAVVGGEPETLVAAEVSAEPQVELGRFELGASVVAGGVIGLLKGLFSVGAGFLIVPVMVMAARVPRQVAVGSSILAILAASVAGTLGHAAHGNIEWGALGWLIPGGLFGSFVGTRAAASMSPAAIRRVFVVMMAVATIYLLALAASY